MDRMVPGRTLAIAACLIAAACEARPRTTAPVAPIRTATLQELSVEVAAGSDPTSPGRAFEAGLELADALQLQLPFPPGTVTLCAQGNESPDGYTHALPQNQYALDFAVRGPSTVTVSAAAAGVVSEIVDFEADELAAGDGYGRQVVIDHAGLVTRYSHLQDISVVEGQRVSVHTPLGHMGHSGHAFERHLHFSVQLRTEAGERVEIPIVHLRAAWLGLVEDPPLPPSQIHARDFKGAEFLARPAMPWSGGLYASASSTVSLSEQVHIARQAEQLRATLQRRLVMEHLIAELKLKTPAEVQQLLEPHLKAAPNDPVTLYYSAVGVLIPKQRWASAERALATAASYASRAEYYEGWLPGWIAAQRALVAKRRRTNAPAPLSESEQRALADAFARALDLFPSDELEQFIQHETRDLGSTNAEDQAPSALPTNAP